MSERSRGLVDHTFDRKVDRNLPHITESY